MSDRVKIHIDCINQDATAKLRCHCIGDSDYAVAVLYDIQGVKPFPMPMFSKIMVCGKEEWFYCDYERTMLISNNTKPADYWLNINKESEDKPMQHNVTIIKEENRVIEEYWLIKAMKRGSQANMMISQSELHIGKGDLIIDRKELDHNPTLQEIAQFLSETQADFVSVEHNYRFADLPFC